MKQKQVRVPGLVYICLLYTSKAAQLLNAMHVPFEMNALSAHRTPEAVEEFAKNARNRGIKVIIAAAGMAEMCIRDRLYMLPHPASLPLVNKDPYGEGWLIKVKPEDIKAVEDLLDAEVYKAVVNG